MCVCVNWRESKRTEREVSGKEGENENDDDRQGRRDKGREKKRRDGKKRTKKRTACALQVPLFPLGRSPFHSHELKGSTKETEASTFARQRAREQRQKQERCGTEREQRNKKKPPSINFFLLLLRESKRNHSPPSCRSGGAATWLRRCSLSCALCALKGARERNGRKQKKGTRRRCSTQTQKQKRERERENSILCAFSFSLLSTSSFFRFFSFFACLLLQQSLHTEKKKSLSPNRSPKKTPPRLPASKKLG